MSTESKRSDRADNRRDRTDNLVTDVDPINQSTSTSEHKSSSSSDVKDRSAGRGSAPPEVNPPEPPSVLPPAESERAKAHTMFFRTLAGKIGENDLKEIYSDAAQPLRGVDIDTDKKLNETWWKPLHLTVMAWVRDALNYIDQVVGKDRVTFADHIKKHDMMFVNLVMLMRWKNKYRQKQTVWPNRNTLDAENQDLREIVCYYLTLFKRKKL